MLKELIAIGMAATLMTAPPQNANDETYYQDVNITETYEYETNEVNSFDDLVEGNIYKLEINNLDITTVPSGSWCYFNKVYLQDTIITTSGNFYANTNTSPILRLRNNDLLFDYFEVKNNDTLRYTGFLIETAPLIIDKMLFYFVYTSSDNSSNYVFNTFVSASDYLGEKTTTIEPVETEGLYNLAYQFLYSRIYTNTQLQGMETTLFGTTINMNMWLSHTTAIVIIGLILLVLIKFVIWLFKIVSGGMLWQ